MNNNTLVLQKKVNFIILLKIKANNDKYLTNYLIYIDLTIYFKKFKAVNSI